MDKKKSMKEDITVNSENAGCDPESTPRRKRNYSKWRTITLISVYVLMCLHVAHWQYAGKSLAPLELNELMYTMEKGIVTAGFLFMALAFVSVLIFGRFFCSWGCHIIALEDLCAWLLAKIKIRPKPVRSRVLLLVPLGALFYMFVWPQVIRVWQGEPLPVLHFQGEGQQWASFVTDDFWRNLPGPWITGLTFLVCGFAIVYFLGTRSFCKYGCPYGAVFAIADRFAPGNIVLKGNCTECGRCTAVCDTHIRVHEELTVFGKVVNPDCLKDLDCVQVCPENAIGFGFTKPALFASWNKKAIRQPKCDFTLFEDLLIACVFVGSLFVLRGLYGVIPFLLSLGVAAIVSYIALLSWRMIRKANVRLNNFQLKLKGRPTWAGSGFLLLSYMLFLLMIHSAFIRYHEYQGKQSFNMVRVAMDQSNYEEAQALIPIAIGHLTYCEKWGLMESTVHPMWLASLYSLSSVPEEAEPYLKKVVKADPENIEARLRLTVLQIGLNRFNEAVEHLKVLESLVESIQINDNRSILITRIADMYQFIGEKTTEAGDPELAEEYLLNAGRLRSAENQSE